MKLSRTAVYAIQASAQLAQDDSAEPVPCSRLAAEGNMPERFLLQVLRSLVNRRILRSTRGVDGGYTLNRPASEVSLLELLEAVDGPLGGAVPSMECLSPEVRDRLQVALDRACETAKAELSRVTLAQLVPNLPPC